MKQIVGGFFLAVISAVKATARSRSSRLQQKLNTLLCRGSISELGSLKKKLVSKFQK